MPDLLAALDARREAVLLGEVGALLHMFGKCSSEFLSANSREGQAAREPDTHQELKHLPSLAPLLDDAKLRDRFAFTVEGARQTLVGPFSDFITRYKRQPGGGTGPDCLLLRLFNTCHRMTSADEKGVARTTQPKDDMWISTPFGYHAQKVDPAALDVSRGAMERQLAGMLSAYLAGQQTIEDVRNEAVRVLRPGLSAALGDTRRPANDVTLWAQSYGVASLYKPVLAALAIGVDPCGRSQSGQLDADQVAWRLLGLGWNGRAFVERGKQPADILSRQRILHDITADCRALLEVVHPVGNLFYSDLNGFFVTFPGIADGDAEALVREIAPVVAAAVQQRSDGEIWPFFTLSAPHRTLTVITREVETRERYASLPRVAPLLSHEQRGQPRRESALFGGQALPESPTGQDICPVCQMRGKPPAAEACAVCLERRAGRQRNWRQARVGHTIWVDEVADVSNRIALLSLRFDLSRWLGGQWLGTLWSQTLDEWAAGERLVSPTGQPVRAIRQLVERAVILLPNGDPVRSAMSIASFILQNLKATERKPLMESFTAKAGGEYPLEAIDDLLSEIGDLYGGLDEDALLRYFFTQNASPARLARIWEETSDLLLAWQRIEGLALGAHPERLRLRLNARPEGAQESRTYRADVPGLAPGPIALLCIERARGEFLTADSLAKFRLGTGTAAVRGAAAVTAALRQHGIAELRDDPTGAVLPLHQPTTVQLDDEGAEHYVPMIALAQSPVGCQVLLPAADVPRALEQLLDLYEERFGKVQGKLPLHVGVLVSNRRFPLYALVEAGHRMLDHPAVGGGMIQERWWQPAPGQQDPFFASYPTTEPGLTGFRLTDLASVDSRDRFWLTPGYFDVDFLSSTADRHGLAYASDAQGRPIRPSVAYGTLRPRPLPLHRLRDLFRLRRLLFDQLSTTQRHQLESALATKLDEWASLGAAALPVYETFASALLRQVFGDRWHQLSGDDRDALLQASCDGLLLECLELFQHVFKEEP